MDEGYWLCYPLDATFVRTLKRAASGIFDHVNDRFNIAYLISQECLTVDKDLVGSVTDKGREAIEFFG